MASLQELTLQPGSIKPPTIHQMSLAADLLSGIILKYFYAEVSYQYVVNNAKYSDTSKSSFTHTTVGESKYAAGLGYIFKLSRHIAIEPRLFYNIYTASGSPVSSGPVFSIAFHNYLWKHE